MTEATNEKAARTPRKLELVKPTAKEEVEIMSTVTPSQPLLKRHETLIRRTERELADAESERDMMLRHIDDLALEFEQKCNQIRANIEDIDQVIVRYHGMLQAGARDLFGNLATQTAQVMSQAPQIADGR